MTKARYCTGCDWPASGNYEYRVICETEYPSERYEKRQTQNLLLFVVGFYFAGKKWRTLYTPLNAGFAIGSSGSPWRLSVTSDQIRESRVNASGFLLLYIVYPYRQEFVTLH
jgi:hypothetical protein